jgi:hypothetical protein
MKRIAMFKLKLLLLVLLVSVSVFGKDSIFLPEHHYIGLYSELFFAPINAYGDYLTSNEPFFDPRIGVLYSIPTKADYCRLNINLSYSFFDFGYKNEFCKSKLIYKNQKAISNDYRPGWSHTIILDFENSFAYKKFFFGYGLSCNFGFRFGRCSGNVISLETSDTLTTWNERASFFENFNVRLKVLPFGIIMGKLVTQIFFEANMINFFDEYEGVDAGMGIRFTMPIELKRRHTVLNKLVD